MRIALVIVAAVAATGCGLLGSLTRTVESNPRPVKLVEYTNVDDTHRGVIHSNDPGRDRY